MKKTNRLFVALTGLLILGMTTSVFSQDWPQWRGANRDGKATGFETPKQWPAELDVVWKVTVGLGDASPVMAGNKVYSFGRVGGDEVTMCLDAATGKEIWQNKYPALAITGPASSAHPGPRSTPAVGESKVVTLGIGGVLSCLDMATGKMVWRNEEYTKELPQFFTGLSPLIVNGMCIVHLGGKETGKIIAFDLKTGTQKWQCASDGPSYSSLMLMTIDRKKQIVDLTDKSLVGVDPENGKLLWLFPAPVENRFYNAASPVIDGQTVIITGQGQGTKAVKIQKQGADYAAQEIWKNAELGTKWNTPVLKNGFLYGLSDARKLYCMNAKTGETAWVDTKTLNDFGEIVDAGSLLIALPQTSSLVIYKPDEKVYAEVAVIKVADTPTYTYPILAGNKIFIKDKESLAMLAIK
jgi:outer membrane protein assembly factor BamB